MDSTNPKPCDSSMEASASQGVKRPATEAIPSPPHKVQILPINLQSDKHDSLKDAIEAEERKSDDDTKKKQYPTYEAFKKAKKWEMVDVYLEKNKKCSENLKKLLEDDSDSVKELIDENKTTCTNVTVCTESDNVLTLTPAPISNDEAKADGQFSERRKKKMYAILLSYSGKGYLGMQM